MIHIYLFVCGSMKNWRRIAFGQSMCARRPGVGITRELYILHIIILLMYTNIIYICMLYSSLYIYYYFNLAFIHHIYVIPFISTIINAPVLVEYY